MRPREPEEPSYPALGPGVLACLPLFLAYEVGQALEPGGPRNGAELFLGRVLFLFAPHESAARRALLVIAAVLAWVATREQRSRGALARECQRVLLTGLVAGVLLGPVLVLLLRWMEAWPLEVASGRSASLVQLARLAGGAVWEELLFRVGAYGILFLAASRALSFLGLVRPVAWTAADLLALIGSSTLFALFHLDAVQRALGSSGEPYHAGVFVWRLVAAILLGALFRWRGLGASAWAHATLNLALALGAGPAP